MRMTNPTNPENEDLIERVLIRLRDMHLGVIRYVRSKSRSWSDGFGWDFTVYLDTAFFTHGNPVVYVQVKGHVPKESVLFKARHVGQKIALIPVRMQNSVDETEEFYQTLLTFVFHRQIEPIRRGETELSQFRLLLGKLYSKKSGGTVRSVSFFQDGIMEIVLANREKVRFDYVNSLNAYNALISVGLFVKKDS
jgi:hypothetical protein